MDDLPTERRRRFDAAPVARLATVRPDGHPHIVPVTFASLDASTIVTAVDHKPKTTQDLQRLRNVAADARVSVLVDHYEVDWSQLWWVRVDGVAHIVEADDPQHDHVIGPLVVKYDRYRDRPPAGPAVVIEAVRWRSWSA